MASFFENGGRLSLSMAMSSAISLPIMSGRVEMSWPSLIKEGPNSLRAEEILIFSARALPLIIIITSV